MNEVTVPAVRKAIMLVAKQRKLQLSEGDIAALATAVVKVQATAWVSDEEAMVMAGRNSPNSWRDFCAKYGVVRQHMVSRAKLEAVLKARPGRTGRPRKVARS